jgi:N-ethylmaleimide reductase
MYTDAGGMQDFPEPAAMTEQDIEEAKREFVQAARHARQAGFDGIELHSANGYLLEQFLHPHTNRREDAYGGSDSARSRFVVEVALATAQAIGAERVGIRVSPYNTFNDLPVREDASEAYAALARALRGIAYVHVVSNQDPRFAVTAREIRKEFGGTIILNGGFDRVRAEQVLSAGDADLISFGRPFISNPDFVRRIQTGAQLAEPDASTFYTPGGRGYVDYPALAD